MIKTTPYSMMLLVVAAICTKLFAFIEVQAFSSFLPPASQTPTSNYHASSTSIFMGKRKKPSMKERRKQRAKKQPALVVERGILEDLPPVDSWEKTQPTVAASAPEVNEDGDGGNIDDDESEQTAAKASSLVTSQRKSVDSLTFIRKRVEESFPISDAAKGLVERGYFVHDGFLSSTNEDTEGGDILLSEMVQESSDMLSNDKFERDIARMGDGEYVARIVGGAEAYADCPRLTEFVLSMTRHFPPLLNKEMDDLNAENIPRLDSTASMGMLRLYDRNTRLGAETLVSGDGDDDGRPFGIVCGDGEGTENDTRRLTAMLFLSSKDWDADCGGGVTLENGERLDAIRDRLILIRSDTCSHRQEPWKGMDKAGLEQASCVTVHFVKENK